MPRVFETENEKLVSRSEVDEVGGHLRTFYTRTWEEVERLDSMKDRLKAVDATIASAQKERAELTAIIAQADDLAPVTPIEP